MISRRRISFDLFLQVGFILLTLLVLILGNIQNSKQVLQISLIVLGSIQLISALNFIYTYGYSERNTFLKVAQIYLGLSLLALPLFLVGISPPIFLYDFIFILLPALLVAWYFIRTFLDYRKIVSRQKSFWDLF